MIELFNPVTGFACIVFGLYYGYKTSKRTFKKSDVFKNANIASSWGIVFFFIIIGITILIKSILS